MSIDIVVYTIEKKLYEGKADSIQLPGSDGELGVLSSHTPLISTLGRGTIRIRQKDATQEVPVNGGFLEIQPESKLVVLAS